MNPSAILFVVRWRPAAMALLTLVGLLLLSSCYAAGLSRTAVGGTLTVVWLIGVAALCSQCVVGLLLMRVARRKRGKGAER